jgi:hypothetical protein
MQSAFSQQNWKARKSYLGHTSENAFEQYCLKEGIQFEHFGQKSESSLDYKALSIYLRTRPDYICQRGSDMFFVEVKGVGRDGILKIKFESIIGAPYWATMLPLKIFVYDSARKKYSLFSFDQLKQKLTLREPARFENDRKLYFPVAISEFSWGTL